MWRSYLVHTFLWPSGQMYWTNWFWFNIPIDNVIPGTLRAIHGSNPAMRYIIIPHKTHWQPFYVEMPTSRSHLVTRFRHQCTRYLRRYKRAFVTRGWSNDHCLVVWNKSGSHNLLIELKSKDDRYSVIAGDFFIFTFRVSLSSQTWRRWWATHIHV